MANEILVTPDEMRSRARTIRGIKNQDAEVMNKLNNLVNSLSSVWRGAAQDAFVAKYASMKPTVTRFQQAIEEYAAMLEEHAKEMEKVDLEMAKRISK